MHCKSPPALINTSHGHGWIYDLQNGVPISCCLHSRLTVPNGISPSITTKTSFDFLLTHLPRTVLSLEQGLMILSVTQYSTEFLSARAKWRCMLPRRNFRSLTLHLHERISLHWRVWGTSWAPPTGSVAEAENGFWFILSLKLRPWKPGGAGSAPLNPFLYPLLRQTEASTASV